ncbi:MAG: class I SAM-dependent methyltransferase [Candidatus Hodarchaeota archaeon]
MKKSKPSKPEEDTYGELMWACFKGREVIEIWERDDGHISGSASAPKIYFSEYEDWTHHAKKAMEFVKGRVLDIACGVGRHSLYLQKKGFDVLGIDRSPLAIKISRLRGLKKAKVMPIEDVDFEPDSFDTILMMGNGFNLLGNFKKAQRLLKRFHRITSEDAQIIAETRDPYKEENPAYVEYFELNQKRGRMYGQLRTRIRFEKHAGKWFDWVMVSKEEMEEILAGTGWKVREYIDSGNQQYIAILEKVS